MVVENGKKERAERVAVRHEAFETVEGLRRVEAPQPALGVRREFVAALEQHGDVTGVQARVVCGVSESVRFQDRTEEQDRGQEDAHAGALGGDERRREGCGRPERWFGGILLGEGAFLRVCSADEGVVVCEMSEPAVRVGKVVRDDPHELFQEAPCLVLVRHTEEHAV